VLSEDGFIELFTIIDLYFNSFESTFLGKGITYGTDYLTNGRMSYKSSGNVVLA